MDTDEAWNCEHSSSLTILEWAGCNDFRCYHSMGRYHYDFEEKYGASPKKDSFSFKLVKYRMRGDTNPSHIKLSKLGCVEIQYES